MSWLNWLQSLQQKKKIPKRTPSLPVALESRVEYCYNNGQRFVGDEKYILNQFADLPIIEEAKDSADIGDLSSAYRFFYDYFVKRTNPVLFLHNSEYSVIRKKFSQFQDPKVKDLLEEAQYYLSKKSDATDENTVFYPNRPSTSIRDLFSDPHTLRKIWELNNHYHFLTLAKAFWITGDSNYASNILIQATEWLGDNPVGFGVNWVDYRSIAIRLLNWMIAINMCLSCRFIIPEVFFKITSGMILHAAVLANHLEKTADNLTEETSKPQPTLEEAVVLYIFTNHYPELKLASKWRQLAESKLEIAICNEFSQKYLHYSNSLADHCFKTDLLILAVLQQCQNNQKINDILFDFCLGALRAIHFFSGSSRIVPNFGTYKSPGVLGQKKSISDYAINLLCLGSVIFNEGKLLFNINKIPSEVYWWLGPEAGERFINIKTQSPSSTVVYFISNGIGIVRDHCGPKSSQCIAIGNPPIAPIDNNIENHCDCLSLILNLEDEPFLIDPGNCSQDDNKEAKEYLATFLAHSAPSFAEEVQPVNIGYYDDSLTADTTKKISGVIYGLENYTVADKSICSPLYKEDIREGETIYKSGRQARLLSGLTILIIREILFSSQDKRIIIRDTFYGSEGAKQLHLQSSLLFAPHLNLIMRGDMGCLARGKKLSARVIPLFPRGTRNLKGRGVSNPYPTGWYFDDGKMCPTNQIRYFSTIDLPQKTYITIDWTGKEPKKLTIAQMDEFFDGPSPD